VAERAGPGTKLALAGGATLVALLLGELVVRLADAGLPAPPPAFRFGRWNRPAADPARVYEMAPNLAARFGDTFVRTDAHGARIPTDPFELPPGDPVDLVVLGDSTSFGWRLFWEQSYPAQVALRLKEAWHRPVRLTNLSVPGYDSEQELAQLRTDVLPSRPDLVLWHVDHNDACPPGMNAAPAEPPPDYGDNVLHSRLLKLALRVARRAEIESGERLGGYATAGPLWERHVAALAAGAEEARQAGVATLLVLFDCNVWFGREDVEHQARLHAPFHARLKPGGARLLDLYPLLRQHAATQGWTDLTSLWVAPDDPHPGAAGQALLADMITAAILKRWPAPPETP